MQKIRAKFQCVSVIPATEDYDAVAHLNAVYANSDGTVNQENKSFSDATPSGNLTISISKNVIASKYFQQGRYYYLDFERIPKSQQEIDNEIAWKRIEEERKKY